MRRGRPGRVGKSSSGHRNWLVGGGDVPAYGSHDSGYITAQGVGTANLIARTVAAALLSAAAASVFSGIGAVNPEGTDPADASMQASSSATFAGGATVGGAISSASDQAAAMLATSNGYFAAEGSTNSPIASPFSSLGEAAATLLSRTAVAVPLQSTGSGAATFEGTALTPSQGVASMAGTGLAALVAAALSNATISATGAASCSMVGAAAGGGGGLSRADHLSEEVLDTSGTLSVTTSAFTPQSSSLLVVCISKFLNDSSTTGTDVMSDSIDGTTGWSRAVLSSTGTEGGFTWTVQIWIKEIATGASMALTHSNANESVTNAAVCFSVFSYTGYDTGTPTGGTASGDIGEDGAGTLTLSAAPVAADVTVAIRGFVPTGSVNTTATPGSGWTEIHEVTGTPGKGNLETQQRTGSTSTTVEWTDINDDDFDAWGTNQQRGAALVIKAA